MRRGITFLITVLFYVFRIFPIKKNKIVISNFLGQGYKEEGAIILQALINTNINMDIVWLANNIHGDFPEGIRVVKNISLRAFYELATAKVWIDNSRKRYYIRKRQGQYYIQTWHGEICIKHIEKDAENNLTPLYVKSAINDSKMVDLMVACSRWRLNNMKSAFWYDGPFLEGSLYLEQKNDEEIKQLKKDIYAKLGIPIDKKAILYAPTFRKNHTLECYKLEYEKLLEACKKKFGGDWVIIIRLHPELTEIQNQISYGENIINGSMIPKFGDLLSVTDILISDYSGVIFKGFKYGKPVFIFATDYESYIKEERGLYFSFSDMPSPLAKSSDELYKKILDLDLKKYEEDRKKFVDGIGYYENDAVKEIVRIIINQIK